MKLQHSIRRRFQKLRIMFYRYVLSERRSGINWRRVSQPVVLKGDGEISFADSVCYGWHASPHFYGGYGYFEARFESAKIIVGEGTVFTNNVTIIANTSSVAIGRDCRIGYGCSVFDSDFHGIRPDSRDDPSAIRDMPVVIEDKVFIGANVTILKGVTIGYGSIIGAGSVVTKSIPSMSIACGNPCRVVKTIT